LPRGMFVSPSYYHHRALSHL